MVPSVALLPRKGGGGYQAQPGCRDGILAMCVPPPPCRAKKDFWGCSPVLRDTNSPAPNAKHIFCLFLMLSRRSGPPVSFLWDDWNPIASRGMLCALTLVETYVLPPIPSCFPAKRDYLLFCGLQQYDTRIIVTQSIMCLSPKTLPP